MLAYFELRERLADAYLNFTDWQRVTLDSGLAPGDIVFQGSSISVWTNILNAIRLQQRLIGLRKVLENEQPQLLDIFDQYAADVASGEGNIADLPTLRNVELSDTDLQTDKINQSLDFQQVLPIELLNMSLTGGQPSVDEIDPILSAGTVAKAKQRLAQFSDQQARAMVQLQTRQNEVAKKMHTLQERISSIERAQRPVVPKPRDLTLVPDGEKSFWSDQNRKDMDSYRDTLALYETERNCLPALRQESDGLQHELTSLDATIAAQQAQVSTGERVFHDDIARARDTDLQVELDRASRATISAFGVEANPIKGLYALLGTNCLLEFFVNLVVQPAAATEAGRRFHDAAETLIEPIQEGLSGIARVCLAAPTLVHRTLATNRNTTTDLLTRLAQLPAAEMEGSRQRAGLILSVSLAPVPQFDLLEKPDDLEELRRRLSAMRETTQTHISDLRSQIDAEPAETRAMIERAQADIKATIDAIAERAAKNDEALRKTTVLWALIKRGRASANLPAYVRKLCQALFQEFTRRENVSVNSVLDEAAASELGLKSARAMIETHLLTGYVADRERLCAHLTKSEYNLEEIANALLEIDKQYERVARKYRRLIIISTIPSFVPGAGLLAFIWAATIVSRLEPLVSSNKIPYVRLGDFASTALAWAVAGATVSCGISTTAALVYTNGLLHLYEGTAVACLMVSSYLALAVAIRNVLTIRAGLRRRKPSDTAPKQQNAD